ncbi:MAG TPA: hypothetical protein VLG25_02375 [Patescibacteria group bacterium]|nr:hypothetical protein [Patescibacteria group bacterium]
MLRRTLLISSLCLVYMLGLIFPLVPKVSAANASDWQAGRIIDDYVFTNNPVMSASDVQSFLNQKVGTDRGNPYSVPGQCDTNGVKTSEFGGGTRAQYGAAHGNPAPFTCLKDYYEVPKVDPGPGTPANNYGGAPIPDGAKSASQIIWDAAQRYRISPRVLLVTIQKESAGPLVTDDWPFRSQYTYAMGAHCPDTSSCDSDYAGFSMQINESARLFRYYLDNMTQPWWSYKKPGNNTILYNPNTSCGSSNVFIETNATAALYTYTPYQPNQAALNNLYGSGDSCSAYGNRNFWRMYWDWFGNPQIDTNQDEVFVGDWDGDGRATYGIRRGNMYYLDNNNDGQADWQFGFGLPTDKLLIGDWDGDGSDELGLKRGDHYYFSTDFNGTSEIYQSFGNPTDQALVGDWDGDGRDSIGLKRGSSYYLDNNYDGQAEIYQGFGNPSDHAFVGDWDGDGKDELGLKRGEWYYLNFDYDGQAEKIFAYGSPDYKVIVGDWDGDGKDSIGLKHGEFYNLANNFDGKTDIYTGMGISSDKSFIGDWNKDNKDTIGIKRGSYIYFDNNNDGNAETQVFYTF